LERAGATADLCPAADGGEGTAAVLVSAMDGELRTATAHDPMGRPIEAEYGLVRDGATAIVEVAAASGLELIDEDERDPERASSAGTGELIAAAVEAGARRVLVAAGGSATTDGGRGAIDALEAAGLQGAKLEVLCDTSVPFELAAEVFAPQKGASPDHVERLTSRLVAEAGALPRDPRGRAMTGAAGGLSGGLWAAFGAHLAPGAAFVLGVLGFDRRLEDADAVITGEGRLDPPSREGKLTGEVARRCHASGVPLHAIVGQIAMAPDELERLGLASVAEAGTSDRIEASAERIAGAPAS
jgi:glycerate kinase